MICPANYFPLRASVDKTVQTGQQKCKSLKPLGKLLAGFPKTPLFPAKKPANFGRFLHLLASLLARPLGSA